MTKKIIFLSMMMLLANPLWAQEVLPLAKKGKCADLPEVKIQNKQLMVRNQCGYQPYFIKGVGYTPDPIGWEPEWGYNDPNDPRVDNYYEDPSVYNRDLPIVSAMNANTIRIWKGDDTGTHWVSHLSEAFLDAVYRYNIKVIAGFAMPWPGQWNCVQVAPGNWQRIWTQSTDYTNAATRQQIKDDFTAFINRFRRKSAILFWAIGNENDVPYDVTNPGNLAQLRAFFTLINEMSQLAHTLDPDHPVAVVVSDRGDNFINNAAYGTADFQMPNLDIWGVNVYRGQSFGTLFQNFSSNKPLWLAEFGVDSFHTENPEGAPGKGYEDQATQAQWDGSMWDEIMLAQGINDTIGGTVFNYSDSYWKPYQWTCGTESKVCLSQQNHFGYGPADLSCPLDGTIDFVPNMPDHYVHEQYWGVTSISSGGKYGPDVMTRKQAYFTMQNKFQ